MKRKILSLYILTLSIPIWASAETAVPPSEELGPEVQILQKKNIDIEEFRSHGKVYMIKVNPKKGPAYYLVDADGDGDFDTRRDDLQPNLLIPSWVLFSW